MACKTGDCIDCIIIKWQLVHNYTMTVIKWNIFSLEKLRGQQHNSSISPFCPSFHQINCSKHFGFYDKI